ncbi:DUF551 domain-containing protein [Raoultella planticola]|uniref:DUF551 domain-containing protein n=1 Tax=Raoultella planticola TaxID=575 RepID=UPI00292C19CF|nr:hypothetical protein [Raoultella planticola]
MTSKLTITRERLSGIARGENCYTHDDVIELALAQLAAMDSEPVAVVEPSDYVTAAQLVGEESLRKAVRELYEGALRVGDKLYRHAQPAPVVPNGLRLALSNAGIAAPESDEMLAATCEKHIQALVTWVKDRKPFQSAPVVPSFEEWLSAANRKPLGWVKDAMREAYDACRAAMLQAGNSPVIPDRWIPVSERMPEETEPFGGDLFSPDVLTQNQDGDMHVCCTQWGKWIHKKFPGDVITHWQNLPPEAREVKDE